MKVIQKPFGHIDNQPVLSFTIKNDNGLEVTAINYGCIITNITVPDINGIFENIVIGHDLLDDYITDSAFLGAIAGRVAGRIKGASFELDGKTYILAKNDHGNHLHGGIKGFNKVIWDAEEIENGVRFSYMSSDGEEGYPGNLSTEVTYTFNNENELSIHYKAHTDQKTIVTLTNHSYFNLSGNMKRDILDHTLTIDSDQFLELGHDLIPTGKFVDVENTPFDFTSERTIKTGTMSDHPQNVLVGKGYDHPFLLNKHHEEEIVLKDSESGRVLTIRTDEPAVVVYTGNSLEPRKYLGICLETQALPDAIHHSHFPSTVLDKNQQYSSVTKYKFGLESRV